MGRQTILAKSFKVFETGLLAEITISFNINDGITDE